MSRFRNTQIKIYVEDVERSAAFCLAGNVVPGVAAMAATARTAVVKSGAVWFLVCQGL